MDALGPRTLRYLAKDGREGEITINIRREADTHTYLGDDPEPLVQPTFSVDVQSDWFSWSKALPGVDDLQSIFRVMWMSDIYIRQMCEDNEYDVFAQLEGDIAADFDVFRQ